MSSSYYECGATPEVQVHDRLRIARKYANLEQEELARRIGVSRSTISNAESGKVHVRRITINAWAHECQVPVSWILYGPGPWAQL